MRKHEAIDLMKLLVMGNSQVWLKVLGDCYRDNDINRLAKLSYQIKAGMDDLAKQKLNDDKINVWFSKLIRDLETTAKKIIKKRHPLPADNTLLANKTDALKTMEQKRKRDRELAEFMKKSSY